MRSKSAAVCRSPGCTNCELEVGVLLELPLLLEEPAFVLEEPLLVLEAPPSLGLEEVVPFMDEAPPEALSLDPAAAPEP
jgi:hypothetical protein